MGDGIVVDANVMSQFDNDYRKDLATQCRHLIEHISEHQGFAVDDEGHIGQEWLATCQGPFLPEWYLKNLAEGVIKLVTPRVEVCHKKHLIVKLGMPQNGRDLRYINAANATVERYILTEDIDFYDPKLKHANAKAKRKARDGRCGPVCRYLQKKMGIFVGTIQHGSDELC